MGAVNLLAPDVGLKRACRAMHVPRSTVYRADERQRHLVAARPIAAPRPAPPLALSTTERQALQEVLCSERFADCAPATIYATLLDDGIYLGSIRTMYRLLETDGQSRERRDQLTHPVYAKPELLAIAPNEVWSWDITKIRGAAQMDLLPSLCDSRHLQPLCRWLDDRPARKCRTGRTTDR